MHDCYLYMSLMTPCVLMCFLRKFQQCVHYVSIQQLSCSKYQDIEEVVPRKLSKAWDRDNQAMVALKLVEVYGFEAASAWADHHVAVSSMLVRYACLVAESAKSIASSVTCVPSSILVHQLLCLHSGIGILCKTVFAENCLADFHWSLCPGCLRIKDGAS